MSRPPSEPRRRSAAGERPASGPFGRDLLFPLILALPLAFSALLSPALTRLLGPVDFGVVAAALSVNQLVVAFAALGMDQAVLVQRAEDGASRTARGLVVVSMALTSVVLVPILLTSGWWGEAFGFDTTGGLVQVVVAWSGVSTVILVIANMLMAERRLGPFATVALLALAGAQVVGVVVVLVGERSALRYLEAMLVTSVVALVLALVLVRPRLGGLRDVPAARRALALGIPLAMNNIAGYVLNAFDRVLIQRALGPEEVARYQVSFTIGYVVVLMLYYLSQSWTAHVAAIRDAEVRLATHAVIRDGMYRVLLPVVLGIALAAPVAVRLLAPASFRPASLSLVVAVVAISAFPVAAGATITRELVVLRRGRPVAAATTVSAVLKVAVTIPLLPWIGIMGAALTTVLAFAVQAVLKYAALPDRSRWPRVPQALRVAIPLVAAAAVGSTLVPDTTVTMAVRFGLGLLCLPWLALELRRLRAAPASADPATDAPATDAPATDEGGDR